MEKYKKIKSLDEMIDEFTHENLEYANETRELFKELREKQKNLEEERIKTKINGLDGKYTVKDRELVKKYFKKFEKIKKKYGIDK